MVFNVMIQLCKITRASRLFQRNFYLPLLKPLSPKDALRRHIITGKNLLGKKIEHYIPVLEEYQARVQRRKYRVKGRGKKRQRKKATMNYLTPILDLDLENHEQLQRILSTKSRGRGQCYTYYVPDRNCTLVFPYQMERAIRDHDVVDVMVAQRSEKIIVKLANGERLTMPIAPYEGGAPFYRGEGWTKKEIEEYHHHGKDTMLIAKMFEAKEAGIEDWQLEMMRIANKRKRKQKGEGTADWKTMMAATVDNMDWDQFEEECQRIVEEIDEPIDQEQPIPMAVQDMDKTKSVNEKLKAGGEAVLSKLAAMPEIPELIKVLPNGELTELVSVSGVSVRVPSNGIERFVPGQMVASEDGELFVPGQTVDNEDGGREYTPGFTVLMDGEPTLLPGLVMGDDPNKPMFLPGESAITDTGELQFVETEDDDIRQEQSPPPAAKEEQPDPDTEEEEEELDEEQNSEEEREEEEETTPPPPPPPPSKPKREKKEFVYERPQRVYASESMGVKRKEKSSKKSANSHKKTTDVDSTTTTTTTTNTESGKRPLVYDLTVPTFEKDLLEQEKERVSKLSEKKSREEYGIDRKKREILLKARELAKIPPPPKYEPQEPVSKSAKLKEYEKNIRKGKFFDSDYKKFLYREPPERFNWLEPYDYTSIFDTVGISRHRIWKTVF